MRRETNLAALLLVVLFATAAVAQDQVAKPIMRIYFMPFANRTYAPITKDNIEDASPFRIVLGRPPKLSPLQPSHPLIAKLPAMLRAHPARNSLDEDFIRLKVLVDAAAFYVDNTGIVLEQSTGQTFQLQKNEMEYIEQQIGNLRGVVDLDLYTGLPRQAPR
jgi:hypothetical protein